MDKRVLVHKLSTGKTLQIRHCEHIHHYPQPLWITMCIYVVLGSIAECVSGWRVWMSTLGIGSASAGDALVMSEMTTTFQDSLGTAAADFFRHRHAALSCYPSHGPGQREAHANRSIHFRTRGTPTAATPQDRFQTHNLVNNPVLRHRISLLCSALVPTTLTRCFT